jgi:hypothetical protein
MTTHLKTRALALLLLLVIFLNTAVGCLHSGNPSVTEGETTTEGLESTGVPTTDGESDESTEPPSADTDPTDETTAGEPDFTDPEAYFVAHPELTVTYTKEKEAALFAALDRLTASVSDESMSVEEFVAFANRTEEDIYALRTEYQLSYVESYLYKTSAAKRDTYLWLSEICNSAVQKFIALYAPIDASKYGETYYKEWDPKEKEQAIADSEVYDEECAALRTKIDALKQEQRDLTESEYDARSEEIYTELIKTGTALGKKLGFNGYMDYAYSDIYTRDYTPEEVRKVATTVGGESGLSPVINAALDRLYNTEIRANELTALQSLLYGSFEDKNVRFILDLFYSKMGGDIYEAYREFFKNGYYYLGYESGKSEDGAFTFYLDTLEVPAIYFGPGYQDAFTFVHEFGHYYNYVKNGGKDALSYDLAETQSQGDEWLFLAFLKEHYYGTNIPVYMESYYLVNTLLTVFISFSVNEFEMLAYDAVTGGNDAPKYDELYKDAVNTVYSYDILLGHLGYPPENYWRLVVIENPGYYVSYAISQIPAMELYTVACTDFAKAVTMYEAIQTTGDFVAVVTAAGLHSPLENEVYAILAKAFE